MNLREAERDLRAMARLGGGAVEMIGATYLDQLLKAESRDEITDDEFYDGLAMLRDYLLRRPI